MKDNLAKQASKTGTNNVLKRSKKAKSQEDRKKQMTLFSVTVHFLQKIC